MALLPRTPQPPPDLPSMPDVSTTLAGYLRNFALWAKNGFADKLSISTAAPGLLLQATDDPTKVFMLTVDAAGTVTATAMALGTGKP
jgi:hypothetical protein